MYSGNGVLQKRNVCRECDTDAGKRDLNDECREETGELKLTLMEELLLVVMDPRGYVSLWNDHVSRAIRGCILIELWMRGKIELESAGMRKKRLSQRVVVVKCPSTTDECMLNEALKLIKGSTPHTVPDWISYLAGDTWNPLKLKLHMRQVRERIFKNLVERGIVSTQSNDYWLMNVKSYPLNDVDARNRLNTKLVNALLGLYSNDIHRVDRRTLTLLLMTQYSGGVDDCLKGLESEEEKLAFKRAQELEATDFEDESRRGSENDLHWAVYEALKDPHVML